MQYSSLRAPVAHDFAGEAHELRDRLAGTLNSIEVPVPTKAMAQLATDRCATLMQVRAILRARRQRDQSFPDGFFADPAWDILLELYASELAGCRLSIGSLCIGAAVPTTTALRWIRSLEQRGLAVRSPDPLDARRVFIALSPRGSETMSELMKSVPPMISLM
jgi:DNA-binding MarR family transcriptional regulator